MPWPDTLALICTLVTMAARDAGMPICTTCTVPIPHLYTVYDSAHNLRLEQCVRFFSFFSVNPRNKPRFDTQTACNQFADPYVEHDSLTLLLDLILLKRGVYLHLLYNRGSEPRRAGVAHPSIGDNGPVKDRERVGTDSDQFCHTETFLQSRWLLVLRLGGILVLVDACTSLVCGFSLLQSDPRRRKSLDGRI
jgi:hypothetical protein